MAGGGMFDVYTQMNFYAAYHNNGTNQSIHMIFVPTILWTALIWCTYTGSLVELPWLPEWAPPPNLALFVAALYGLYYIILEPVAGVRGQTLYLPFLAGLVYGANKFAEIDQAPWYALGIHVVSWAMQFYGHGVYEKRKPALLDSLVQALTLAPLFVWLELLFSLGYNPKMAKKIDQDAKKAIAEWRNSTGAGAKKTK